MNVELNTQHFRMNAQNKKVNENKQQQQQKQRLIMMIAEKDYHQPIPVPLLNVNRQHPGIHATRKAV